MSVMARINYSSVQALGHRAYVLRLLRFMDVRVSSVEVTGLKLD